MGQTHSGVAAVLHDILSRPSADPGPPKGLLDAVSSLAQPGELTELLLSLCKDDQAVAACAARSFRHPLGFDKLTLIDALPQYMLRIHAWWPGSDVGVDHIHNHRFDFVSSVVCGGYDMQVYERDQGGSPMIEFQEQVSPDRGWRLQRIGISRLRQLSCIRLNGGAGYGLSAEALHRVVVRRSAPCVTLFCQSAMSRSMTDVFVSPDNETLAQTPKKALTAEAYSQQLQMILAETNR